MLLGGVGGGPYVAWWRGGSVLLGGVGGPCCLVTWGSVLLGGVGVRVAW